MAEDKHDHEILEIGAEVEQKQLEKLRRLKQERDNSQVKEVLGRVREVAVGQENIMPVLIDAVEAYATVGEISDVLRDVFGEYREPSII